MNAHRKAMVSLEDFTSLFKHKMLLNNSFRPGMKNYCERYSKSIHDTSMTFKPVPRMEGPDVDLISDQLNKMTPLDKLKWRRVWRDQCLTKLSVLKREMKEQQK